MSDYKALPDDHVLKPLEDRLLEMCGATPPAMRVLMGNAVAALRVFASEHPGLFDDTATCDVCGFIGTDGCLSGEEATVSLYLEDMGDRLVWRCRKCS